MLRNLGASYFVVQPGFWSDLALIERFNNVGIGPDCVKVAHFGLTGDLSMQNGTQGIDVLRPADSVDTKSVRVNIDMPLAGRRAASSTKQNNGRSTL
jgi:hypothetical protein